MFASTAAHCRALVAVLLVVGALAGGGVGVGAQVLPPVTLVPPGTTTTTSPPSPPATSTSLPPTTTTTSASSPPSTATSTTSPPGTTTPPPTSPPSASPAPTVAPTAPPTTVASARPAASALEPAPPTSTPTATAEAGFTPPAPGTTIPSPAPAGDPDRAPVEPGRATVDGTPTGGPERARVGDAEVERILDSLQRSGASSTTALLDALRVLEDLGLSPRDAAMLGMGRFPVTGHATFRDDWHAPRLTPTPHLHQGNDIFAAFGTPVRAPAGGALRYAEEAVGGKAAYLTTHDGTWYYLAHLDGFAPDLATGATVDQGRLVGFVGDTGNARGGAPHVHFEVHPGGGPAVNPKPVLDGWLSDALAAVPSVVAAFLDANPRVLLTTGQLRRLDPLRSLSSPSTASVLLWSSSVSAGGGTVRLAAAVAARLAARIDWARLALAAQARNTMRQLAQEEALGILTPVTPPLLARLLGSELA